ncbi:molybdopterin-dependent oxidoreductase [Nocardia pseudovaccinii]|uniref:molybdopterin-dependent oxidoreductase n=1 Tax=Nocardia pseudovaccinii TaxID=189540 RepID=UPI0007A4D29A|nr:molybdopterin-dependent oxidoreductase [Nocardia pseudovaccinii]
MNFPATARPRVTTARGPAVASRVGIALGSAILLCFGTGLLSHWIQHPPSWFWWPAHPVWLYRVTQGAHVISGVAAIPLLLVKLWAVYPRLFHRPIIGSALRILERGSIAILVGATIFQLSTGLLNIAQYYPWKFFFPTAHYAMAYVAVGALAVHLSVKLPVIRDALRHRLPKSPTEPPADTGTRPHISRRAVLTGAGVAAVAAGLAVAGQTIPFLRWAAVLAPRSGHGPQGVPVNRSAAAAGVGDRARDPEYRLTVAIGDRQRQFTRDELLSLPQTQARLPIACVEGWSAGADWSGVRLLDLLAAVGDYAGGDIRFRSLEQTGIYGSSILPQRHAIDDSTLVALTINGETLDLDHGYPCRLIAPNRPGVLQTKWLSEIEVLP